ncbi:isoleucyl-tRNA synthetase [Amycolatopsis mediterranei S699]|uniref:Isoleucine--tRNA ligase n=2 Tax=Amycolatopsis mediterranei TaxID=33910 RepID=A0A0H3D3M4_AMYMU|nr:isoleucine--tRNA ligase [Amycolatopsis mediterranei]ADJ44757.1 isoleucyl-tRNA synthetase [Amycolatopsis mediterranei U32]AEK41502.1 isoleucyl-tRNA synthetase [Amycolatopsis mediterranei S699]AFO76468.1 isoleucyl-tRNA synthetase [Amycolatopsis mediterranei S699]AGT83597.1 isoleucyl-tRNA synthetase [Amycolatopsis mediterranei RB]KDO07419.1 isoleucine--tRNA ligase [Amycolatopsis mediterranei]
MYPQAQLGDGAGVPSQPSFPALEKQVLAYWESDRTFQATIDARPAGEKGENEYVFYDGPPFANGLPHYGHLLTGYVKDLVPRYQTMKGHKVERRFGWDTHGLPAELEAMRQLGITETSEIEEMGIAKFNAASQESVLRYTDEWREYVTRQARWVDFDNDYKTLDVTYMESVLWAFKRLWDKGLVYEGYRVLPYCWRDATPLSNHELGMDSDVYRNRQDPAVTVGFRLEGNGTELDGTYLLIWTTTPWTLPSNLATAVHPEVQYVVVESEGKRFLLAEARVAAYARELGEEPTVVAHYTGTQLLGTRYAPPFPYFLGTENAHQVLAADYVTTDDGTGIVHIAPAYGADDKVVTDAAGIPPVTPVDAHGKFDATVPDYEGQQVFDANPNIVRDLKNGTGSAARQGAVLLRHETYDHSYPHCWRCRNPLIYRAVSSWFVAVTQFKDRMVELNQQITWYPENVKDGQFGKWLENAIDWSISRNRYFGTPIPVWQSDDPAYPRTDVYGSLDELEADFGVRLDNLHRPYIDDLTRPNPDDPTGQSTMRRVPDVLDVWFDSGSMPYAQVHYPFENAEWFEHHYPSDFIVEYIGQTRGWFYLLHVLATALFDRPAFRTCVSHGIVLGSDGAKMSKSLRNYPDVNDVFERDGSDAMRWYLMASPILRGGNLVVTDKGIRDAVRQAVLPLWNSYYFLALYANAEGVEGKWRTDSPNVLDRYVLAKTHELVTDVEYAMDHYDVAGACQTVRDFLEVLTNWYVRRSRDRFWAGDQDAIDTLHTVLEVTSRVAAPLLPLTTEVVWRGLTGGRSVHLTDWPNANDLPADAALVTAMDRVRQVASSALSLRKANKLRVRLPLSSLVVAASDAETMGAFADILRDEVNVKAVELTTDVAAHGGFEVAVNARAAGPRLGKDVQTVIKAVKAGDWSFQGGAVVAAGIALQEGEFERRLVAKGGGAAAELPGGSGLVLIDTEVTPELAAEGLVRDLVRVVQQARRDAGLDVADRIALTIDAPADVVEAARTHEEFLASETLATSVTYGPVGEGFAGTVGDGTKVTVAVAKA